MRKAILLTAATAFLAVPTVVQAQASAEGIINAVATLDAFIQVDPGPDVRFDDVNTASSDNRETQLGRFDILHSHDVSFAFDASDLTRDEDDGEGGTTTYRIVPSWECAVSPQGDFEEAGDETLTLGGCADLSATMGATDENGRSTNYFYVGGNIDGTALADHAFGEYTGTITLTASSNN
jgi:hypothetical protein